MKMEDKSKEIFEKYYESNGKILEITLKNGEVLEGIFVSVFHGAENSNEPYINKWHFVAKSDIPKLKTFFSFDDSEEVGKIINQSDIKDVRFKD
jgi:ribosomal protein L24